MSKKWGEMTGTEREKAYNGLLSRVDKLSKRIDSMGSGGVADMKLGGGAFDFVSEGTKTFQALRDSVVNTGDLFEPNGKLFSQIAAFGEQSVKLFGRIDEGLAATKALQEGLRTFSQLGDADRAGLVGLTLRFKELGVNMSNMNSILDSSIIGFQMTAGEARSLSETVAAVGNATGVGMREAVKNFAFAQTRMAYSTSRMMENFKGLQLTSAQTGIGFEALTNAFGDSMDTFEGSASKAGNLNAILGRSVFNSIDLLGKTEAQRVETIVQGIRNSVDVKALGRNKFQLKAVAEGLGLNVDQTRRLLSGQMSVQEALAQKKDDPRTEQMKKMAENLGKANDGLEQFDYLIRRSRSVFDNLAVSINLQQRDVVSKIMTTITDSPNANPSDFLRKVNELSEAALKGGISADQIGVVINTVTKAATAMVASQAKFDDPLATAAAKDAQMNAKMALQKLKADMDSKGDPTALTPGSLGSYGVYTFGDNDTNKRLLDNFSLQIDKIVAASMKLIPSTYKLVVGEQNFTAFVEKVAKEVKKE